LTPLIVVNKKAWSCIGEGEKGERMETHYTHTRKVRHCKTCSAKCDMEKPIVGCESLYVPTPPLKIGRKTFGTCCVRRIWFDENYFPVDLWDSTKITDDMTPEEFWDLMAKELKKAQAEATKHK